MQAEPVPFLSLDNFTIFYLGIGNIFPIKRNGLIRPRHGLIFEAIDSDGSPILDTLCHSDEGHPAYILTSIARFHR